MPTWPGSDLRPRLIRAVFTAMVILPAVLSPPRRSHSASATRSAPRRPGEQLTLIADRPEVADRAHTITWEYRPGAFTPVMQAEQRSRDAASGWRRELKRHHAR